jgi:hypothetical protein
LPLNVIVNPSYHIDLSNVVSIRGDTDTPCDLLAGLAVLLRQDLDELLNERGCVSQTATVIELAREIEKARLEAGLSIEELLQILREEREKEE